MEAGDSSLKGADSTVATRFLRGSHGLLLHCIHSAQAPDALLIKLHGPPVCSRLLRGFAQSAQLFFKPYKEQRLQVIMRRLVHWLYRIRTTGTLQLRTISVVVDPITRLRIRLWP